MAESLAVFLKSIRWQDIVDILLNSYILYRLYVLFRGTAVWRVLVGISVLLLAKSVAEFLGLIITSWAIQGITAAAALIIIVVFRNEIRSVLQVRNLRAFFWGSPQREMRGTIGIVADAAYELARKKTGAIIVLQSKDELADYIRNGIAWQGLVSREMLESIFWNGNPVHDGAAIIVGDRITTVGGVLPLSSRSDLPSFFGTRHRAAAGLAEQTDAMVVVVSEERGEVSVAKGDQVERVAGWERLAELLEDHLTGLDEHRAPRRSGKREFRFAALTSLVTVAIVWFIFTRSGDTLMGIDVPLEFTNRNQAFDIIDASASTVHLQLSGSGTLLKSVQPEQVRVQIDLGEATVGRNRLSIAPGQVALPPGVYLKKVVPASLEITLDELEEKSVPVQVDWAGKLPENLIMVAADVEPAKIEVSSGKHAIEKISTLYTEKVPLDGITQSGELKARV
ncbi:MAG: diadenylate cyclase, partial [Deltaproteobacteria bacterium]|nr:diadenylate cyclase [Deltaproteobacteria bacterium]